MDLETIRHMSNEAAEKAAQKKLEPYTFFDKEEMEAATKSGKYPFPFIGDHVPKGWKKIDEWFCDSSGFGADNEPALSKAQLAAKIRQVLHSDYFSADPMVNSKPVGFALTECGQFQVRLGVYEQYIRIRRRGSNPRKRKT